MRLVVVKWHDAHGSIGVEYKYAQHHKPVLTETVGWLLTRDEDGVSISCERAEEDGVLGYKGHTFIPAGMIVKVSRIK